MMKFSQVSQHAKIDRIDRLMVIAEHIGWGEIVMEAVDENDSDHMICLTSTGVMIIKGIKTDTLITAYVPTPKKLSHLCHLCHREFLPETLTHRHRKSIAIMQAYGMY